jgi:hypothetical protein
MDPKMGCVIFVALKLTKSCMKMLHLKDFERWVHNAVRKHNPPKGRQDAGVGGPAPDSQIVGSLATRIEHNYIFMHILFNFTVTQMKTLVRNP